MFKNRFFIVFLVGSVWLMLNGDFLFFDYTQRDSKVGDLIPHRDRQRLEYFFRRLVFWDDAGYVLMGSKPCSISAFRDPSRFQGFNSLTPSNLRFWLGWKTWKKYEKHFPHPAFSILREDQSNGGSLIILVNHKEFLNTIRDHRDDFERILQKDMNPKVILNEMDSKPLFSEILQNNDFLIGILLGYGKENARIYHRKMQHLEENKSLVSFVEPEEHQRFSKYISKQGIWSFASGSLFNDMTQIPLPGFSVDPSNPETKSLRKKYSAVRKKMIDYFFQRNFLDAILDLACQEPPTF